MNRDTEKGSVTDQKSNLTDPADRQKWEHQIKSIKFGLINIDDPSILRKFFGLVGWFGFCFILFYLGFLKVISPNI